LIKPRNFDESKKYPLILNIYGEPAGTTVNDSWAGPEGFFSLHWPTTDI